MAKAPAVSTWMIRPSVSGRSAASRTTIDTMAGIDWAAVRNAVGAIMGGAPEGRSGNSMCSPAAGSHETPARVFSIDTFPTTPSANGPKIQRNKLRLMAEERLRGE